MPSPLAPTQPTSPTSPTAEPTEAEPAQDDPTASTAQSSPAPTLSTRRPPHVGGWGLWIWLDGHERAAWWHVPIPAAYAFGTMELRYTPIANWVLTPHSPVEFERDPDNPFRGWLWFPPHEQWFSVRYFCSPEHLRDALRDGLRD